MKVVVIYKDNSDHAREVIDYLRDFRIRTGKELETLDPETRDGVDFCRTYDIMLFPTFVALSDEGLMQTMWQGSPLPTISEVSYYVQ